MLLRVGLYFALLDLSLFHMQGQPTRTPPYFVGIW